jgi:CheY-like chemotaxis protein
MPDMNGFDATKKIKLTRKTLPIIAQTAYAMSVDEDNCLRAGCDDYIAKPLQIDDLLNKVNKYLFEKKITDSPSNKEMISLN